MRWGSAGELHGHPAWVVCGGLPGRETSEPSLEDPVPFAPGHVGTGPNLGREAGVQAWDMALHSRLKGPRAGPPGLGAGALGRDGDTGFRCGWTSGQEPLDSVPGTGGGGQGREMMG